VIRSPARRWLLPVITGACLALLAGTAISALLDDRPRDSHKATTEAGEPRGFGGLVAPNARLAGLFQAGGAPIRTKGVQSVQRIDVGAYCVRPTAAGLDPRTAVAQVTPEYFYSDLNEVEVQWASTQSGCGNTRFGVYTLADPDNDGNYTFSDEVGFAIVVP
jgi:hypothetical protein